MGLVLKRYVHEGLRLYDADGLYIGHIVVEGVDGQRVKLYFDVDSRFHILRDELLEPAPATSTTPYLSPAKGDGAGGAEKTKDRRRGDSGL